MTNSIDNILDGFAARTEKLGMFEIFSGEGAADGSDVEGQGISVSEASAFVTVGSLGLMGISKGLHTYGSKNKMKPWVDAVKPRLEALDLNRAIQAAKESGDMTKLMELLPNIGTVVKRFNFEAVWDQAEKTLIGMRKLADAMQASFEGLDDSYDTMINYSDKAYKGFKAASILGASATTLTAVFYDRAVPFLDEFKDLFDGGNNALDGKGQLALAEVEYRMDAALGQIDTRLDDVEALLAKLPDFQKMIELIAQSEKLLDPISSLVSRLDDLSVPYDVFLGLSEVISAPISGVLDIFESPPKVLPTITGYKTITEGFWDPITTKLDPFDLLPDLWIPAVKTPIFGLKELLVSALGAVAKGSGDFTFDMNDLQTFDGMPRPEGEASIVVSGLNSVFDQLIEAGLLQPDQLMPIRMGLGMGFVATGEDELTSEVEVRSNGGVYVNGQRMR